MHQCNATGVSDSRFSLLITACWPCIAEPWGLERTYSVVLLPLLFIIINTATLAAAAAATAVNAAAAVATNVKPTGLG